MNFYPIFDFACNLYARKLTFEGFCTFYQDYKDYY